MDIDEDRAYIYARVNEAYQALFFATAQDVREITRVLDILRDARKRMERAWPDTIEALSKLGLDADRPGGPGRRRAS